MRGIRPYFFHTKNVLPDSNISKYKKENLIPTPRTIVLNNP